MSDRPGTAGNPLRVAIVGSGPAGFYAAEHLLQAGRGRRRGGHVRPAADALRAGARRRRARPPEDQVGDPRLREDGGARRLSLLRQRRGRAPTSAPTELARALPRGDLRVRLAPPTASSGSPARTCPGSHPATEFVAWYNAHPDFADLEFDLSCERAVVIGNGNVATDVARMLALTREELEATDTADHAIDALGGQRDPRDRHARPPRPRAGRVHQSGGPRARRDEGRRRGPSIPPRSSWTTLSRAYLESDEADITTRKNVEIFTEFSPAPAGGQAQANRRCGSFAHPWRSRVTARSSA